MNIAIGWLVNFVFASRSCVYNACGFSYVLLGQIVTAHLEMPRSIPAHARYLSSKFNCSWKGVNLLAKAARSFA